MQDKFMPGESILKENVLPCRDLQHLPTSARQPLRELQNKQRKTLESGFSEKVKMENVENLEKVEKMEEVKKVETGSTELQEVSESLVVETLQRRSKWAADIEFRLSLLEELQVSQEKGSKKDFEKEVMEKNERLSEEQPEMKSPEMELDFPIQNLEISKSSDDWPTPPDSPELQLPTSASFVSFSFAKSFESAKDCSPKPVVPHEDSVFEVDTISFNSEASHGSALQSTPSKVLSPFKPPQDMSSPSPSFQEKRRVKKLEKLPSWSFDTLRTELNIFQRSQHREQERLEKLMRLEQHLKSFVRAVPELPKPQTLEFPRSQSWSSFSRSGPIKVHSRSEVWVERRKERQDALRDEARRKEWKGWGMVTWRN